MQKVLLNPQQLSYSNKFSPQCQQVSPTFQQIPHNIPQFMQTNFQSIAQQIKQQEQNQILKRSQSITPQKYKENIIKYQSPQKENAIIQKNTIKKWPKQFDDFPKFSPNQSKQEEKTWSFLLNEVEDLKQKIHNLKLESIENLKFGIKINHLIKERNVQIFMQQQKCDIKNNDDKNYELKLEKMKKHNEFLINEIKYVENQIQEHIDNVEYFKLLKNQNLEFIQKLIEFKI